MRYHFGIPEELRREAAALYDEAFAAKLRPAIQDDEARAAVIAAGLSPAKGIAALDDGALVGIAGFHDEGGSLTGGITFGLVRSHIGPFRAIKALLVFSLLDRRPKPGELLMDGIVVRSDARGRGIGTGQQKGSGCRCVPHVDRCIQSFVVAGMNVLSLSDQSAYALRIICKCCFG